jgi:crossover junction endodeoxyribonuclease RuvC
VHFIGIDPGLSGAVAVLDHTGALAALCDTPVLTLRTGRGSRTEYDLPGMAALLRPYTSAGAQILIEEAQAMPGQGIRSMFQVGLGFGVWLGMLGALGLAYTRIRPPRLEAQPGTHQGQRAGTATSHAAVPWRRSAPET